MNKHMFTFNNFTKRSKKEQNINSLHGSTKYNNKYTYRSLLPVVELPAWAAALLNATSRTSRYNLCSISAPESSGSIVNDALRHCIRFPPSFN